MSELSRREFLAAAVISAAAGFLAERSFSLLRSAPGIPNPLEHYPDRSWEEVYRDQYAYDEVKQFVCSPNCTHACRMDATIRNGVVMRLEPSYDIKNYSDLLGNQATAHWHPRGCNKGFTLHRRVYGPYRLKYPMVRQGWKVWADDGFPPLNRENRRKYKFDSRGTDTFVRLSWDEAFDYIARGMVAIAKRYSGEEGARILAEEGYPPEMIEAMHGAGTRTFKLRGGMGLLGVIGKYGLYRFANMLALLDQHVRGVGKEEALGGRKWSNYTWHGDQAPGLPFVHGLQSSDVDFNELRHSRLHIQVGKNLIENKMADTHFFTELMERGAKIIVITPEYSPPATKADFWISLRPATDTALFLGVSKIIMDEGLYDEAFLKDFSDMPFLVRTDTLRRLRASEVFPGYRLQLTAESLSFKEQGLKPEQYESLGDFVVYDEATKSLKPITRDDVGQRMHQKGLSPALSWKGKVRLTDGQEVEVMTLWEMYKIHLRDYTLETVSEITGVPQEHILRLAREIGDKNNHPVAIHMGEGINHWFHATEANRAICLPLILTGNFGKRGSGCHTWAGNYKAALFQATPWAGPGFLAWIAEDPYEPNLDPNAPVEQIKIKNTAKDEEPAYWNHGDRPLIVDTPKYGRKVFTGKTHMPTPTKVIWYANVNLFNNAKWAYDSLKNVNPNVDLIIGQDIEMTASIEYSDFALPANSWVEFQTLEITASCSNPFLQIWKGVVNPIYDTKDDVMILAGVAKRLGEILKDHRFADYWKFALEGKPEVYIQRLLDASATTKGYKVEDIMAGKYGAPGAALMMFRTYPRLPFYEQVHDSKPFYTDTGRLNAYCDIPEAIECGENFIVHREGPEATPYLPNVIVSTNPYVRPDNYGFTPEFLQSKVVDADIRTVANNKLSWEEVKKTRNPLWAAGFHFYCLTPKSRHRVHSSWCVTDWNWIWDSSFADPYRTDKRAPGVAEHQLHINPEAAKDLGLQNGDYVYVDANPADRPYRGADPKDPFYKVARLMVRIVYNPAYPYNVVMLKHGLFMATEKTVWAHENRPDKRALSPDTGYQASVRYGSQQSVTRDWSMPMHQTDTLFHKSKIAMAFMFGGEADNHALNTVPKETLVRIVKAEPGGLKGRGVWSEAKSGYSPRQESEFMQKYLSGEIVKVRK
jgi:nitrate reductase alpha subunit